MNVLFNILLLTTVVGCGVALWQDARQASRQVRVKPRGRWF